MTISPPPPLLECRSLCYGYEEGTEALTDVDFRVAAGEFVALLASNGSGKTTLIKIMAGLLKPRRGSTLLDGTDIRKLSGKQLYSRMGFLAQNPQDQLFGATVCEDIGFGPRNLGLPEEEVQSRVQDALASVGGRHLANRAIHHLSFGEQKRVALAGVLAMRPSLLLLDEVTAGLDPAGESQLIRLLNRLNREEGITIVFATHSVDMLPLCADRICVLERGRVLMCDSTEKIFNEREILDRAGLRLPYISRLFDDLRRYDGLSIEGLPLTVPAARRQLRDLLATQTNPGRPGFTTGACAAAAAKAALHHLLWDTDPPKMMDIPFPGGERLALPIHAVHKKGHGAEALVRKDAGDDPDITHGAIVKALVEWSDREEGVVFVAGDGVGTVTRKGLSVPPGEPAITPGPRRMIRDALRELSDRPLRVTLSIPGGRELAEKTYNPRLGIINGLSILGTTGRVRPFSCRALRCALKCQLDVAHAAGVSAPVLVPGHIGERSARRHLTVSTEQIIEVGNEWGFLLERLSRYAFRQCLLWGHPGKLAKLANGEGDTHSSRSAPAVETLRRLSPTLAGLDPAEYPTTEGLFAALEPVERQHLADALSAAIAAAATEMAAGASRFSVVLVNLQGDVLGTYGDLSTWR